MVNLPQPPRGSFKAFLWDYDDLLTRSDEECCYSLSEREIQILLANLDTITWATRYQPTATDIDKNVLLKWQGNLARKLMTGCCPDSDAIYRYLPDGTYQRSDDGGETWVDAPTEDPRYDAPLAPPLPGTPSDAMRCAAADNVRAQFLQMRDNTIDLLTAGTTVLLIVAMLLGLVSGILAVTLTGAPFSVMLFSLAGILLSLTPESVEDQIDDVALDAFRCLVYCNMTNDGRLKSGGFENLLMNIADDFSDFPETFFYTITASLGATGINNAAVMGTSTADDCGDCGCPEFCGDESLIVSGTMVAQGDGWIEIQAGADFYGRPGNWIRYGSEEVGVTCCTPCIIDVTGTVIGAGRDRCNGTVEPFAPEVGSDYIAMEWKMNSGADTIKLTFLGSDDCP